MSGIANELEARESSIYNILLNKNRTLEQQFHATYLSASTEYNFDFSPYSGALMQVRKTPESSTVFLEFSTTDGSIVLGTDGRFKLIKTASEMNPIRAGEYYYDIYLIKAGGIKRAFLSGKITIYSDVTR